MANGPMNEGMPPDPAAAPPPGMTEQPPQSAEVSDEDAAQVEAQAVRFTDAAMVGVVGSEGGGAGLSPQVQKWIEQARTETQDPGEVLGKVAADVGAAALAGNLRKGVDIMPAAAVIGTAAITDKLGTILAEQGVPLDQPTVGRAMQVATSELFEITMNMDMEGDLEGDGEPYWNAEELGEEAMGLFGEGGGGLDGAYQEAEVAGNPFGAEGMPPEGMPPDPAAPPPGMGA